MANLTSAIFNYWQQSFWQIHYNQFPVQSVSDPFYKREDIISGNINLNDQDIWVAPYVLQNKNNQYWIPIWLPASVQNKTIQIRKEMVLPWVGPVQLSALYGPTPFKENFSVYENYLRFDCFEDEQLVWQNWSTLLNVADDLLSKLAPNWQDELKQMGYPLLPEALVHIEQTLPQTDSRLFERFVNLESDTIAEGWQCLELSDNEKLAYIEKLEKEKRDIYFLTSTIPTNVDTTSLNENWAFLQNRDEQLERRLTQLKAWQQDKKLLGKKPIFAWFGNKTPDKTYAEIETILEEKVDKAQLTTQLSNAIRKITVERTKIHQQLVEIVEAPKMKTKTLGCMLFKLNQNGSWQAFWQLPAQIDTLVVDTNQCYPNQLLPFFPIAKEIVFLGNKHALSASPLMSVFEDEINLKKWMLDEESIEEMQYRGMLVSNGDLFKIAQRAFTHPNKEEVVTCTVQAIAVEGEVTAINNQWQNEQEADFIAKWLSAYEDQEKVAIVTPFYCQKIALQSALHALNLSLPVFTFYELKHNTFEEIVFSPVYQLSSERPFVFDQDEKLLRSLLVKAKKLWLIGDVRIFDAKMHSPSGMIGKLLQNEAGEQVSSLRA